MPDIKGDKLFVNLGPSQAKRRLKGFGHGVRKVQSAGRNQAVIIHTATGRHLTELQQRFADVGFSSWENSLEQPIENLRNLGTASAAWLREVGVSTIGDLEVLRPVAAYQRVRQDHSQVTVQLLWALAGGLADIDAADLTESAKAALVGQLPN